MKDTQGTCGSYDMTALSNLVSLPLSEAKQMSPDSTTYFSEKEGWELYDDELFTSGSVTEGTWDFDENFHDVADKQQLSQYVKSSKPLNILISFPLLQYYKHANLF